MNRRRARTPGSRSWSSLTVIGPVSAAGEGFYMGALGGACGCPVLVVFGEQAGVFPDHGGEPCHVRVVQRPAGLEPGQELAHLMFGAGSGDAAEQRRIVQAGAVLARRDA